MYDHSIEKPYEVIVNRHVLCHDEGPHHGSTSGQFINRNTEEWLESEIGWENWARTVQDKITFHFRHKEDKVKFILRWI